MNDVMPSISNTRSLNHINNYQINNKNSWSTNEDSTLNDTVRDTNMLIMCNVNLSEEGQRG
jgi:hypothetical protein